MATVLVCGDCSFSAYSGGVKFNQTWEGPLVFLIPQSSGLTTLNFDKVLNGYNVIPGTVVVNHNSVAGAYVADDITNTTDPGGARQLQTQGATTRVGAISSYNGKLTGSITFPVALSDNTDIFIKFQTTDSGSTRIQRILVAKGYNEDPCGIPNLVTPCLKQLFSAEVCAVDLCAGDAPGIYVDDLLVLAPLDNGSFVNVTQSTNVYTYEFSTVTADYVVSSLIVEGVNVVTTNVTAVTNLANLVVALNASAITGALGVWTTTGTTISIRTDSVLGNIAGTGNLVAFNLATTVTAANGVSLEGYWINRAGNSAVCNCEGKTYVYAFSPVGLACTSIVQWKNGVESVRLDGVTTECLYTFTLPAVAGTGYVINSLAVNGVQYFSGAQTTPGATTVALAAAFNAEAAPLGVWTAPSVTTIAVRSREVLSTLGGTNNGVAMTGITVATSACL
jgi:hypothetical protein